MKRNYVCVSAVCWVVWNKNMTLLIKFFFLAYDLYLNAFLRTTVTKGVYLLLLMLDLPHVWLFYCMKNQRFVYLIKFIENGISHPYFYGDFLKKIKKVKNKANGVSLQHTVSLITQDFLNRKYNKHILNKHLLLSFEQ